MPIDDQNPASSGHIPPLPDPHGHAALLLVESLIHGLLSRAVMTVEDALEIIEAADDVQVDYAMAADGKGAPMWQAHALLTSIAESLKIDRDDEAGVTRKRD